MGPDWWTDAWLACQEMYDQADAAHAGPAWDDLTMEQQTAAVYEHLAAMGDLANDIRKTGDV